MTLDKGQEVGTIRQDLTVNQEPDIDKVLHQILEGARKILVDPRATTLTYPTYPTYPNESGDFNPHYEHGSQVRFAMLKKPGAFGRDEVCVAFVNNVSDKHPISLGAGFTRLTQGKKESLHEIAIMRFVQTPSQKLRHDGIVTKVSLSDTDPTFTGTFSKKGKVFPYRIKPSARTFAERWQSGNAQLAIHEVYEAHTENLDFTEQDYKDILDALNRYEIDSGLTNKVAKSENKMRLAKAGKEPISIVPKPETLTLPDKK